ncbi:hypothetical protein ACHAXN_010217 [Cyclotella atomus]
MISGLIFAGVSYGSRDSAQRRKMLRTNWSNYTVDSFAVVTHPVV